MENLLHKMKKQVAETEDSLNLHNQRTLVALDESETESGEEEASTEGDEPTPAAAPKTRENPPVT